MDVLARYSSIKKPSSSKCELSLRLAIQIKQSGRSAVFFSAPKGHTNEHLTSSYVMAANDKAGLHLHSAGLTKIELLAGTRPIARSAVFAGSKDVDTATLYGAAVSAAQSCEVFRQATATHFKKSRRIGDAPEYRSWLGVVVINAPMFSCYREGGEIALEPCDIVCQKVWVETEDADAVSRGVIAVHLDKFAEFLKMYTTDEDRNGIGYGRARLKHLYFD